MKSTPTSQKLRGGYYTPPDIAEFITSWAIQDKNCDLLEPSCGDGVFIEAAVLHLRRLGLKNQSLFQKIHAVEFDSSEASKTAARFSAICSKSALNILSGDFFSYCLECLRIGKKFSAVIGNPPFIRYQNFPEEQRERAFGIMRGVGLNPNKLTNAWLPFLIGSSLLLKDHGRLGMVIPAELFQVNYAAETRKFLGDFFSRITIVTFKKLLFDGVLQEVVLLLCEKEQSQVTGIRTLEFNDARDLKQYIYQPLPVTELVPLDHSTEKWTKYYLGPSEVSFLRALRQDKRIQNLGEMAEVDVGVVTGQNDFFILNADDVNQRKLQEHVIPIVTRSNHLEGLCFSAKDWRNLSTKKLPYAMFYPKNAEVEELPLDAQAYIKYGEENSFHQGYKCSIRKRWYIVPSVHVPNGFLLRQVHAYPKLILNTSRATSTDTIHRVSFRLGQNRKAITSAFINSLTFAFSEITGRSYGGGVLTFEPSEAERLPLPIINAERIDFEEQDSLVRSGNIEAALDICDKVILHDGLGLSKRDIKSLRNIWKKMRDRRMGRG